MSEIYIVKHYWPTIISNKLLVFNSSRILYDIDETIVWLNVTHQLRNTHDPTTIDIKIQYVKRKIQSFSSDFHLIYVIHNYLIINTTSFLRIINQ